MARGDGMEAPPARAEGWVSVAPRMGRVPGFDVIRGVGVLLVVLAHARPEKTITFAPLPDWFFVISGFLITTLLLEEYRFKGTIALKKFYARRSLRLLPNLYAVLLFCLIAINVVNVKAKEYRVAMKEIGAAAIYVYNWIFPFHETKDGVRPSGTILYHIWTLSIEEQFYVVIGIATLVALRKGWIRQLAVALLIGALVVQIMRLGGHYGWHGMLLQRPDALMLGVALAVANAHVPDPLPRWVQRWAPIIAAVAIAIIGATMLSGTWLAQKLGINIPVQRGFGGYSGNDHFYWIQWGFTVVQWGFVLLIIPLVRIKDSWLSKRMDIGPLVTLGATLSYAIYIWHLPIQIVIKNLIFSGNSSALELLVMYFVPIGVAVASYYLIEKRALRIKDRFAVIASPKIRGSAGDGEPAVEIVEPGPNS